MDDQTRAASIARYRKELDTIDRMIASRRGKRDDLQSTRAKLVWQIETLLMKEGAQ